MHEDEIFMVKRSLVVIKISNKSMPSIYSLTTQNINNFSKSCSIGNIQLFYFLGKLFFFFRGKRKRLY